MDKEAEQKEQLKSLEGEKERMIARYMTLQDQADAVNEEIYKVCCGVEALNARISALQEKMRQAALKSQNPANGQAHGPSNGKGH